MKKMKIILLFVIAIGFSIISCSSSAQEHLNPWGQAELLRQKIKEPLFAGKDYLLTEYGARGDGTTDCSEAFRRAIEECSNNGGGRIVVPEGIYITGPLHLLSNTNIYLTGNAVVKFDKIPRKYLPLVFTRWEGVECMNYSPFIYAYGQQNIAVTGRGLLDGQANDSTWWPWKGKEENGWRKGMPHQNEARDSLFAMGQRGIPVADRKFGDGFYLRPAFIEFYKCKNILIEGIRIINSPMWEIHPVLSQNIIVRNVDINSHGPNNDGCNPESCQDVLIEGCSFNTGDDCIAIKSGRNNDGRRINVTSENILIRGCRFRDGHGGVTIGSEISGGARNIFAEDCQMDSPILYSVLRLKSNAVRGGTIENIYLRRITVGDVGRAVVDVDLQYEEGEHGDFLPTIRNIEIDGMTVQKCAVAMNLVGYEKAPLRNIRLLNCNFKEVQKGYTVRYVDSLEIVRSTINGKKLQP
jgi:polygalacturonase